ncbi:hypothetical protein B0O99DRAFT_676727 [Bisporella sp. PMI_857]|nr:hypothetical protein B0O99DRAFT_676727 [Bisporella sp. PMI_857]
MTDSEDDMSDFDLELPPLQEERDILTPSRQSLGLSRNYVEGWSTRDAFREFYQNMVDGIVEAKNITRNTIIYLHDETATAYTITLRHKATNKVLGFIQYDRKKGEVQMSNYGAQLPRRCLELGVSTKRGMKRLAGTHGEGFKVGALVMVREGYKVRYEASSFYWNFSFGGKDKRTLYCNLSPQSAAKLQRERDAYGRLDADAKVRRLKGNIWEDVTVRIGCIHGCSGGNRVQEDQFKAWLTASIDLVQPSAVIETFYGQIILDPSFRNKIFLKGLLLETSRNHQYGYNFFEGHVNRDRQRMTNTEEEALLLAQIWGEAIQDNAGKENTILHKYTMMLLRHDRKPLADVKLAKDYITIDVARHIWKYLIRTNPNHFYYGNDNVAQDTKIIEKSLRKVPEKLPEILWFPFRKYRLARTPQEQVRHVLSSAQLSTHRQTTYSRGVERMLRAILALDPRTNHLELEWKEASNVDLNMLLEGSKLMINNKWVNFSASHRIAPCALSSKLSGANEDVLFSCDHILLDLYNLILLELSKRGPENAGTVENNPTQRWKVEQTLREMPRLVNVVQGLPGELIVSWRDFESQILYEGHGLNALCQVTLHCERTCADRKMDLVETCSTSETKNPPQLDEEINFDKKMIAGCSCPRQVVPQKDYKASFTGLSDQETYFAAASRAASRAFVGVSTTSISPRPIGVTYEVAFTKKTTIKPIKSHIENRHAEQEKDQLKGIIEKLHGDVDALRASKKEAEAHNNSLEAKLKIRMDDTELQKQNLELKGVVKQLRSDINVLHASQKESNGRNELLCHDFDALQAAKSELEAQNEVLQAKITNLSAVGNPSGRGSFDEDARSAKSLISDLEQAQADQARKTTVLQTILEVVQGSSAFSTRNAMFTMLRGISSEIQIELGSVAQGGASVPAPLHRSSHGQGGRSTAAAPTVKIKRARDEGDDEMDVKPVIAGNASKRSRQGFPASGAVIDLDG